MTKPLILGYSPWGNGNSIFPFDAVFDYGQDVLKKGFDNIDALVLWGGTDIHPSYYKEKHHQFNQAPPFPSDRDRFEWKAMVYCKLHNIPIIGVCRGAQFLCAFAGGSLIQHVDGHNNGNHKMVTKDGESMYTTSAHHQMLYPYEVNHELLAWSQTKLASRYENGDGANTSAMFTQREPECVYFPEIRGLGIQGHPEWMNKDSRMVQWFNELIIEKLFNEVTSD